MHVPPNQVSSSSSPAEQPTAVDGTRATASILASIDRAQRDLNNGSVPDLAPLDVQVIAWLETVKSLGSQAAPDLLSVIDAMESLRSAVAAVHRETADKLAANTAKRRATMAYGRARTVERTAVDSNTKTEPFE